ncbi:alpha/beta hydrolase [Muricauda sp. CAU 1633]|uniref:alpha/beta fold hydrolase n=1 Tax=Allomuricauda sp. CAU 1633 TaxID=2816036 RepID=UPI001A8F21F8|nr:alpha/beta hydrolase [Muricauda sp. CAU 1633]MBO0323670.1 alpha/beta hydrolase [Muricauda sp. CAU 1633]
MKLTTIVSALLFIGLTSCKQKSNQNVKENPNDIETQSIIVNSEKLHYIIKGNGEPLIFVHGHISDYRTWKNQIDTFSTKYKVVAYSRRYAYPNKRVFNEKNDFSPKIHSEDLMELINVLGFNKVHLVGHSYGGYTALETALNNPNRVKSLVLGEPPVLPLLKNSRRGDSLFNELKLNALEPSKDAFNKGDNEKGVATFVGGVMGDSSIFYKVSPKVKQMWMDNYVDLRGLVSKQEFTKIDTTQLKKLNIPVLLIKGEFSPKRFSLIIDELDRFLPQNKTYTLSNSSHGLQGENPDDFNKEVLNFIDRN